MSEEEKKSQKKDPKKIIDDIFELAEAVIFSIFLVLLIFTYIFRISEVAGHSMEPTLHEADRVLMQPMFYSLEQNDIVIINSSKLEKLIVKRIIALEGQTVDIDFSEGIVYVDGKPLDEQVYETDDEGNSLLLTADHFVNTLTTTDMGAFESYPVTVPEGYVFVLGDNRNISKDSKHVDLGFVPVEEILGEVVMRIYPRSDFGLVK